MDRDRDRMDGGNIIHDGIGRDGGPDGAPRGGSIPEVVPDNIINIPMEESDATTVIINGKKLEIITRVIKLYITTLLYNFID